MITRNEAVATEWPWDIRATLYKACSQIPPVNRRSDEQQPANPSGKMAAPESLLADL
jgi:hypothetical protein